ncbi:MAG: hypothetical protein HRF40_01920 [Nitrososphaera sp.]|jgi:hypothetical protein
MNASVLLNLVGSIIAQGEIKSLWLAGGRRYSIIPAELSPMVACLHRCEKGILIHHASAADDYVESIISVGRDKDVKAVVHGSGDELFDLLPVQRR